jgi:hypothetical protein
MDEETIWRVSADVAGPLLAGFVLWTLIQAENRGLDRLFFLARDGQILSRMADLLGDRLGIPVQPSYLMASRQSLYLPAIDPEDSSFEMVASRLARGRRLKDVAQSLELSEDDIRRQMDSDPPSNDGLQEQDVAAVVAALQASPLRQRLRANASKRREAAMHYFEEQSLFDEPSAGIVDVGWRGNLQLFLATALRLSLPDSAPRLDGFYFGLHEKPAAAAGTTHCFSDAAGLFNEALIEAFCAADHGFTVAFDDRAPDGYILASESNQEAVDWGLNLQQAALMAYTGELADLIQTSDLDPEETATALLETGTKAFLDLKRAPGPEEASVYGRFIHADSPDHTNPLELGRCSGPVEALRDVLPGASPRSAWPQATLVRTWSRYRMATAARALLSLRSALAGRGQASRRATEEPSAQRRAFSV